MRARFVSGLVVAGLIGGGWGWQSARGETRLTFLSVGQGSCAVLQTGGRTILFDAGPKTDYVDGGKRFVIPKLRALGVSNVDAIVLSHPDLDHAGGLAAVLERYPRASILVNAGFQKESKLPSMFRTLGVPKSQVVWLPPYVRLTVGEVPIELASPPVQVGANDNDGSVLARIGQGAGGAFIGGDAPMEVEAQYRMWVGPVAVITADHHGSRTSGDPGFLATARPKWTVISVGRNNVYGHPNPIAMRRYQATGSKILRTDQEGDISFVRYRGYWRQD